jgi:hypothetical protein
MAVHRGEEKEALAEKVTDNARRFFGRPFAPPPAVR